MAPVVKSLPSTAASDDGNTSEADSHSEEGAEIAASGAESPTKPELSKEGREPCRIAARPDELERPADEAEQLLERLVETLGGLRRSGAGRRGAVRNRTRQALSDSPGPNTQHVLEVLEGLGIEPRLFLEALYGEDEHAPFPDLIAEVYRQKLREMDAPAEPPAPERQPADPSARVSSLAEPEVRQLIEDRLSEAFGQVMPKKPD